MTKTNFFTQLSEIGLKHVSLEIRLADNGSMTVFVTPKSEIIAGSNTLSDAFKVITPFTLTATPQQLDEDFFGTVSEPLAETGKVISNMESYKANLEEANKLAAEKSKAKAKLESSQSKEPVAPKISKAEQAKLDKIEKAEANVREQLTLIKDSATFAANKGKLNRMIVALDAVVTKEKTASTLYQPALDFFNANNVIIDGSFIEFADPNVSEKVEDNAVNVAGPVPPAAETPEPAEAEAEEAVEETAEEENVVEVEAEEEHEEDPGQSLAAMNAERTEERKSQLRSLGMTEDNTGFTGHGFNVRQSTIEGNNAEYWDQLIKGIQDVVNKDNVSEAPQAPAAPAEQNVADIVINAQKEQTERFGIRRGKLEEMGFIQSGLEFKQGRFVLSAELVKTNDDAWFDKVIEHFTSELDEWKQRTQNRIIELASYGIKETDKNKFSHETKNIALSINEIENEPDDRWNSAIEQIKNLTAEAAIPPAPIADAKADLVFVMNPTAPHSYEDYKKAGWNEQQLVQQGLGSFVAPEATASTSKAPEAPAAPASLLGGEDESLIS